MISAIGSDGERAVELRVRVKGLGLGSIETNIGVEIAGTRDCLRAQSYGLGVGGGWPSDRAMFIGARVQTGNRPHQRRGFSVDVGVPVVGADGLAMDLVVIQLHVERGLNVGHRAARSHEKVIRSDLHHFQVVAFEKLLDALGFLRRGRKTRRELGPAQEFSILRRVRIVKFAGQSIELGAIMNIQPDADLDGLGGILASENLCGRDIRRGVVGDELSARRKRRYCQACE